MDTFIAIGIAFGVAALGLLVVYLIKKYKLNKEQLSDGIDFAIVLHSLVEVVIKDSKMFDEYENIDKYVYISALTLDYLSSIVDNDEEALLEEGVDYAKDIFLSTGMELNDNKEKLIEQIVKLTFNFYKSLVNAEDFE